MQRGVILGIVLAQACGFSGSSSSIVDAPPPPIDDGTPVDTAVDTIDGSMPIDSDGDAIADASDNCPTVGNPQQRNFDADPRGDACDPCPHLADEDDDPDGDNIGVGCDPRPAATDQRLLWTSFHDASAIAGWQFPTGTWLVENGRLKQSDPNTSYGLASPPLGAALPRVAIATRYTIDALGPLGGGVDSAGLGVASANTPGQYNACIVSQSAADNRLYAAADWNDSGNSDDLQSVLWTGNLVGATLDLAHDTLVDNRCTASQGPTTVTVTSSRGTGLDGVLYLYTQRAAGTFHYMFVVGIGN